jgi:hypothetical protein
MRCPRQHEGLSSVYLCGGRRRLAHQNQLGGGATRLHLQLQCRSRQQLLRQLRVHQRVADLEQSLPVAALADDDRLQHLARLEHRKFGKRDTRPRSLRQRCRGNSHRGTVTDSG